MNQHAKVIILTGASSGIGEGIARHLAHQGHKLVMGARRTDRLASLCDELRREGASVDFLATDVTQRSDTQRLADFALEEYGRIDVMINNAGVMPLSPMSSMKVEEWDLMLDVNVRGVLYGIAAVLPTMQAQRMGHIINIASVGALTVSPTAAVYCATKYAVRAISDGLRQESRELRVTVINPGVVESELADSISDSVAREAMKSYRQIALKPDAIAMAVSWAIDQPGEVDVNEITVRPTASGH
ncbi:MULTISPECIES: SDR family oxidoreductase [unclassified Pantoea]|uniref:SDR family oxidoreductase n=1 Tax=unclassified Pantoea TaxID=2630326 RepID=UPI001CD5DC14|nr:MULTISPECIES: SDR family oxidoreductase [unclassified Pantoea]MCA1177449.1 SDR family oxidoreductase [Pantoea sp. alder69]MCA1249645.1 SDR family oxidoreductase [Pantoea sp. alder70]MCA1265938.1 SDR family oxidoreductase [Pantoea sp. alder81]